MTEGLLCRVALYRPSQASPCMECRWSEDDYTQIEDTYSCDDTVDDAAPGGALRNEAPRYRDPEGEINEWLSRGTPTGREGT